MWHSLAAALPIDSGEFSDASPSPSRHANSVHNASRSTEPMAETRRKIALVSALR